MIRKVITTLGIVLLAIGMFSCEDSSTPATGPVFAEVASQNALVEGTGITSYTVTLDKAVALATGVTALGEKVTLTHTLADGNAATTSPSVTAATIDETDAKMINLEFDATDFDAGDKLKIAIVADSIADTADKVKNAAISVEVTVVAPGPAFAATQDVLYPGAKTQYTVMLDTNVAVVDGKVLADEITLTHGTDNVALTSATISTTSASNIDLVFDSTTFAVDGTFKIDIAAGAIQSTATPPVMNAAMITTTVTVAALPSGPDAAGTQEPLYVSGTATMYTVTLDKNVALVASKTLADEITVTHTLASGSAATTPDRAVSDATISGKTIALTFTTTDLALGDTLKIDIASGAIEDTTAAATQNADITTTVTVVAVPDAPTKATTQETITAGAITEYTATLNNAVELYAAATTLTSKITTLAKVPAAGGADVAIANGTATINANDPTKINLTFDSTTFAENDKLKIVIAADAVKNKTSDATPNTVITIEVTVVAAP